MRHSTKGNRISKQNYCFFCEYRAKLAEGTICLNSVKPIELAMRTCPLLKPFDSYKEARAK